MFTRCKVTKSETETLYLPDRDETKTFDFTNSRDRDETETFNLQDQDETKMFQKTSQDCLETETFKTTTTSLHYAHAAKVVLFYLYMPFSQCVNAIMQ